MRISNGYKPGFHHNHIDIWNAPIHRAKLDWQIFRWMGQILCRRVLFWMLRVAILALRKAMGFDICGIAFSKSLPICADGNTIRADQSKWRHWFRNTMCARRNNRPGKPDFETLSTFFTVAPYKIQTVNVKRKCAHIPNGS